MWTAASCSAVEATEVFSTSNANLTAAPIAVNGRGISCVVTGAETIPAVPLAPGPQHQVLAATKEAMNNVLKHARATEVQLQLSYHDAQFEVCVTDNGAGFDLEAARRSEGNGLRNMQSRLKEIGGSVTIASESGKSRAAVLREAVSSYRAEIGKGGISQFFGLWADRKDIEDGLEYQRRLRAEWDREWDEGSE